MDLDLNIDCDGQLTDFKSSLFADYLSTDTTLSENTDLKQLDLRAEQLKKTLVMQKFDYLPTLSLTSLYQWSAMNNDFKFRITDGTLFDDPVSRYRFPSSRR